MNEILIQFYLDSLVEKFLESSPSPYTSYLQVHYEFKVNEVFGNTC